ncbi:hypothetical protein BCD_1451 (plasmid) [Borrelia crocidurae DOU]|uniref:Uncharacterized protein n=1 Tax=Borrelia crocidurae DOU TaxID=1293575 RepID=W5SKS5_9SPIR|nr:hypothetical protein BCD_1451 [Borrelia crocidurae DOU]
MFFYRYFIAFLLKESKKYDLYKTQFIKPYTILQINKESHIALFINVLI